jgi:hypothetical protein
MSRKALALAVLGALILGCGPVAHGQPVFFSEYCSDPYYNTGGVGIDTNLDGIPATSGAQSDDEFVEIVNGAPTFIDISNWTLSDSSLVRHTFAPGTMLPAGAAIVVFGGGDLTTFTGLGLSGVVANGGTALGLTNTSDSIILTSNLGIVIATHSYVSGGPGDADGESVTRDPETITGTFTFHSAVVAGGGILHSAGYLNDGTTPWPPAIIPVIPVAYPGSGEDFTLETGINGPTSGGAGNDVKTAVGTDTLSIYIESNGGTFDGQPFLLIGELFTTGAPPVGVLPTLHLSLSGYFILVNGVTPVGPGLQPGLQTFGNYSAFGIPSGLTGSSILIQALAVSGTAANGFFAITDAHEIQIL